MASSDLGESLFEKLSGVYADGTPVEAVPRAYRRAKSIADHLWRMYNTRRGALPHMPDYGLPDINAIYQHLPASLKQLEQTLLEITAKYEPRLDRVRIRAVPVAQHDFKLSFELSAAVKGGERVLFQTHFTTGGQSTVEAVGRRE
jgi:type VI secretion system protein